MSPCMTRIRRMLAGTCPCSIFSMKASSAPRAPAMVRPSVANVEKIASRRRIVIPSSAARQSVGSAVEHPGAVVGRWNKRRIAKGGPEQAPERVVKSGDRVPGGLRLRRHAKRQISVPGKILQLGGADEDRRIEALDGVEPDVLDPGGIFGAEIFPLHRVAGDDLPA